MKWKLCAPVGKMMQWGEEELQSLEALPATARGKVLLQLIS